MEKVFTKILLPKKNVTANLKAPAGVELLGVSNIYEALIYMNNKNKDGNITT